MRHIDTIILVEDIEVSRRFYEEIMGLDVLHDWGNMIVFSERFSIHKADALQPESDIRHHIKQGRQGSNNVILYFETPDIEKEYSRITCKGARILHGIVEVPWQKIFRIYDPDDHIIEIGNPF